MTIPVAAYWPFFKTTERRWFHYVDATGTCPSVSSLFSYDLATDSMLCKDYDANGTWLDTWYLQYDPSLGLKEWRDDYPQKNALLKSVFGPVQEEVLSTPILWGNLISIGQIISNYPTYNPTKSWPPFCVIGNGYQVVVFEALLPSLTLASGVVHQNVLQFSYAQTWNGKTTGARYWNALEVGPVALQWIGHEQAEIITLP